MSEKFASVTETGVASGTNKTALNLFNPLATPTRRAGIYYLTISSAATPADQAAKFYLGRTTAVGTEGSGYTPVNLDPGGPAGECDSGIGVFSVEPTYTSSKELLVVSINQRVTFQWHACFPGAEFFVAATQNNGLGLKTSSSSSTQAHEVTTHHVE